MISDGIISPIIAALIAGAAAYFGAYTKAKAERRAYSEDLKKIIEDKVSLIAAETAAKIKAESAAATETLQTTISNLVQTTTATATAKLKAESKAATEDLQQTIANLEQTTSAVARTQGNIADQRATVYALATATQSFVHSMCWLSWDAMARNSVRPKMAELYDAEAHKLLPEIFGQLAVLRSLDSELHSRAYEYASRLVEIDVRFGTAIVAAERDNETGTAQLSALHPECLDLQLAIDRLFGGKLVQVQTSR